MATVQIPTPLRGFAGGNTTVSAAGSTVGEVLGSLCKAHPELLERIFDGDDVRRFVNVYLNNEDIRFLDELETPCKDDDEIGIIPAIAGG